MARHLIRENWYRDLWLFVITGMLLLALRGLDLGPLHVNGLDDVARRAQRTAEDARGLARENRRQRIAFEIEVRQSRLTRSEVKAIAKRQAAPTRRDVLKLIRLAARVCTRTPTACQPISSGGAATPVPRPRTARPPPHEKRSPRRKPHRPGTGRPGGGGRPPGHASTPPGRPPVGQPPPARPPAVVEAHTPGSVLSPGVCIDSLIRIDCP